MSGSSELKREREVQGYAQSWKVAQGSSLNVALNVDSIELYELRGNGFTPRASRDKALTAFAQLAVFRLGLTRGMISLIDQTAQHVLAEATRNMGLVDLDGQSDHSPSPRAPNVSANSSPSVKSKAIAHNDLWLGAVIVSRSDAMCEHALTSTCTAKDPDCDRTYTAPGLIISNCQDDPRFCNRPYVKAEPGIRFYAAVPIVSRNGHKIGVYSVSDEKPRDGLTIDELKFMQGVAQAVMEHLEWARDRVDRFKGERIVRGLAAFIEGCAPLCDESKEQVPKSPSTVRPPEMSLVAARRPNMTRTNSQFRGGTVKLKEVDKRRRASSVELSQTDTGDSAVPRPPEATPSPRKKTSNKCKVDGLSRMFHRAADILRQSTLADGVILFGATTTDSKEMLRALRSGGNRSDDDDDGCSTTQCNTSGSENGAGLDSSDSDTSPSARPCQIFSYSLADEKARADIEQGTALSLGALEKYFRLFPRGKTFSFTDEGSGLSSEDDSASDREPPLTPDENSEQQCGQSRPNRKVKMDHRELLKKIPGAKSVVFVPLFDHVDDRLYGGCFLWTSVNGRIMNLDADLSYLRAFSNAIMSSVGRINTHKNEAAKTTFIASISHELRSPLHGILGAAEFLKDMAADPYQTALIDSISICGKTLLDTLNHVLDYSKINRLGGLQMRRGVRQNKLINLNPDSLESMNMTAVVDLAVVLEEVVGAISAGHIFKLPGSHISTTNDGLTTFLPAGPSTPGAEGSVSILLDIDHRISWMVRTQPGAIRRIIMNLFGNALKYTSTGYVLVSLRGQLNADKSKINALIRIEDTGKGMSEEYRRNRLFVPFSQEDSFQPGTGLGLSIVKQIVDSLHGNLEVKSEQYKGTEVDVRLRFTPGPSGDSAPLDETMQATAKRTRGKQVVLLKESQCLETQGSPPTCQKLTDTLSDTCKNWFGFKVAQEGSLDATNADIFVYCEPPPHEILVRRVQNLLKTSSDGKIPIVIIICPNAEQAVRVKQCQDASLRSLPVIVEVIPQPCGPRKLGRVISHCLDTADKMAINLPLSPEVRLPTFPLPSPSLPTAAPMSPPPLNPETPSLAVEVPASPPPPGPKSGNNLHLLLVDDNKINLQLLVMFMKKCKFTYEVAENGQEALDKFKAGCLNGPGGGSARRFDFVLMDISMPVMNGIEATKHIRAFERENKLPRSNIIALTGLASADSRREADAAGVDIYLPKPVKFAELKSLLSTE
ncbi:unnamed protein product [Clonostachys chloroleuca]|uniref:Uncharacterized protein n=1 Tax=Clonostachys chloroleuca TaxID=1926264 RepID=A0AA35Q9C8_9HYPO|nr:unnamed protein product [Clonostachys chloroleuca]